MSVKTLDLRKKLDVETVLIQDPDGIIRIYSGDEFIPRIPDGPQMSRNDVAGHSGHSKILGDPSLPSTGVILFALRQKNDSFSEKGRLPLSPFQQPSPPGNEYGFLVALELSSIDSTDF